LLSTTLKSKINNSLTPFQISTQDKLEFVKNLEKKIALEPSKLPISRYFWLSIFFNLLISL
jgi:hypothetical protein